MAVGIEPDLCRRALCDKTAVINAHHLVAEYEAPIADFDDSGTHDELIAVAKPDRDRNLGHNTLKAALFHSGRPVLMCPHAETPPATLGAHVSLAWNGSAEAARALSQCISVLRTADAVSILSNGSDSGPGTSAEDLVDFLRLHGIAATIVKFDSRGKTGRELLKASTAAGADMMVMGAYGDSHERETVFGGNTQTVVDTATTPVIFNH